MIRHAKCYIKNYPRPQFVRKEWEDLNGEWSFAFGEEVKECEALFGKLPRKIEVPFTYETKKSGIGDETPHDTVWYARKVTKRAGKRNILNIEGADYLARTRASRWTLPTFCMQGRTCSSSAATICSRPCRCAANSAGFLTTTAAIICR